MPEPSSPPHKNPKEIVIPKFMPFFWLSIALLAGILTAAYLVKLSRMIWLVASGVSLITTLTSVVVKRNHNSPRHLPFLFLILFFFIGGLRYQAGQPSITPSHSAFYNERGIVEMIGVVTSPPEVYDSNINLTVRVESLTPLSSDEPLAAPDAVQGRLILQVMPGSTYHYGDRLSMRGKLQTPPDSGDFSYQDYLANKGIYSVVSFAQVEVIDSGNLNPVLAALYRLKEHAQLVLQDIFPSPESELLSGILLGNDNGLSKELKSAYQVTGTAHIIAISGFNIALLAGLVTTYTNRWLGPRRGTLTALLVLTGYTLLVGADASVVRAVVMGSFGMLGALIGQRGNGLNTLGLAAFLMCLINPNLPWDVGFQLSFFATLGLVLYASPLQARLKDFLARHLNEETASSLAGPFSEYFIFTLVAQALTLPLIAWHFGDLSWLFLLANPLILPVQPPVMLLGGLALAGGLIAPDIGRALAWLAWPFAAYTNRVVSWLADLAPVTLHFGHFPLAWVVIYYVIFFTLTLTKDRNALFKRLATPNTMLLVLGCGAVVTWSIVLSAPDGKLSLNLLPDSDNPVALIETPGGRYVLINGSVKASSLREETGKTLPFGRQELDMLVIPLCRKDDVSALIDLQDHFKIDKVVWACDPDVIQTTRQLYQSYQEAQVSQTLLSNGAWLELGNDAKLTLLEGGKDASTFSLEWERYNALLVFGDPEKLKLNIPVTSPVMILPGSSSLEEADLFAGSSPQLVLLSVNENSLPLDGDLPLAGVFSGVPLLRTDQAGSIRLSTDGEQLWIDADRQP